MVSNFGSGLAGRGFGQNRIWKKEEAGDRDWTPCSFIRAASIPSLMRHNEDHDDYYGNSCGNLHRNRLRHIRFGIAHFDADIDSAIAVRCSV